MTTPSGATAAAEPGRATGPIVGRLRAGIGGVSITDALALIVVAGEWTGIARAAFGAPVYAAALDVVLVILGLTAAVRAARSRSWRLGPLGFLIAAYFVLAAVEILNPNVPSLRAGLEGFRKTAFTAIAFAVVALSRVGDPGRFYRIVAVGSLPAFLMAIRQFVAPSALDLRILDSSGISPITFHSGEILRAFSPTAGPFHLGILAASVMVISYVAARRGSRLWLFAAILAAVAMGLTLTRANLAGGLFSLFALAVVFAEPGRRVSNLIQAAPAAAAGTLAVMLAVGAISGSDGGLGSTPGQSPAPVQPGSDPPSIGEVVGGVVSPLTDRNLQFRFGYWATFLEAVLERPITGYGTSAAADGFRHFYDGTGKQVFEPHSLYFKAALEMGIPGFVLLVAILLYVGRLALLKARSGEEAGLFAVGILLLFAVSGLTAPMLDAYPANVLFWATCGWCLRASQRVPTMRSPDP